MGLSKDSMESLNAVSRGTFFHLFASEARSLLDRISGKTPCTSIHNELPEKEKKSSPDQEEEVLIAKSQPLQSQGLSINPKPSYRNHEGHKEDQEEQQQWLEDINNLCAIAIEWMDEVLDKINPRVANPREILDNKMSNECHRHGMMETMFPPIDIHEETPLEIEKEDDISKHGSYFMRTSSNPCSHEKSP